uniref:Uncharacterized protein n=1 Tax=Rhizochromulina marina TaxID=1034831 RepID=A0A7S2SN66_9STRA|mmetsp:Transcript_32841/g.94977  ORF Transcript_32841/g.94977 Transcript_32841/m.94977 type:complete len:200 (+) Transcript_32841:17-616(+)
MAPQEVPARRLLAVYTLDPEEHRGVAEALERSTGCGAVVRPLRLKEVRHFRFPRDTDTPDAIILCHFAEGRTLLTDTDGLYNAFLSQAVPMVHGNVFLALTNISTPPEVLANSEVVAELVHQGGQGSIGSIHSARRFLTFQDEPAELQLQHIASSLAHEAPVAPLSVPSGIETHAASTASSARRSSMSRKGQDWLCTLL